VAWQFLAAAIDAGSRSLMSSEPLVRAVMAPALVFPISEVIVALVHAGLALIALFALALLVGAPLRPQLVLLPAGIALLVLFTLGLVLIAMTVVTFFRDLEHVMQVLLLAYYFASPVIYPAEAIQRYRVVLTLNPMTYYLDIFRAAFVGLPGLPTDLGAGGSYWPAASVWLIATASACGSFAIGYVVYKRHERAYIFQL
jgi:ABC-type polysaccharide/polyol phosphate export permease